MAKKKPNTVKVGKYDVPVGDRDEDKLVKGLNQEREIRDRVIERLGRVKGKEADWRTEAREDIEFYRGNQWKQEEKAILDSEGRPCLTINEIKPVVDIVQGYYRENSGRIRVNPIGGEDQVFSEIFDRVIRFIDRQSKLSFKLDYAFDTGITCGKTFIEMARTFEDDPIFGRLKFLDLGPYKVYVDDRSTEYDLSDAEWLIKEVKLSKSKLKMLFPKYAKRIDAIKVDDHAAYTSNLNEGALAEIIESDQDNYDAAGLEPRGTVTELEPDTPAKERKGDEMELTLHEEWCRKAVEQFCLFYAEEGRLEFFDTEEEAAAADAKDTRRRKQVQAMAMSVKNIDASTPDGMVAATEAAAKLMTGSYDSIPVEENVIKKQQVLLMYVYCLVGGHLLQAKKSPLLPNYNSFSIHRFIADWFPHAETEKNRVHGIVRQAKDPQREINKARSSQLHIIATGANTGYIITEEEKAEQKKIETMGSTPGVVLIEKKQGNIRRLEPTPPPVAQMARERAGSESVKKVTGINADLMGTQDSKSDSGRQMAIRIRQAIMVLSKSFKNFRFTKELIGQAIFKMIPDCFNASTIARICGETFMQANELDLGKIRGYLHMVKSGEYEVVVSDSDNSETVRQETFEGLVTLAEKGMPIPPDVLIEFAPISNKKEIQARILAYQEKFAQMQAGAAGGKR